MPLNTFRKHQHCNVSFTVREQVALISGWSFCRVLLHLVLYGMQSRLTKTLVHRVCIVLKFTQFVKRTFFKPGFQTGRSGIAHSSSITEPSRKRNHKQWILCKKHKSKYSNMYTHIQFR